MRNTKLSISKEQVITTILGSFQSFIDDNKVVNEESLRQYLNEGIFCLNTCRAVRDADRTRTLDKIVQGYFGEDTAEDLLTNQDS